MTANTNSSLTTNKQECDDGTMKTTMKTTMNTTINMNVIMNIIAK
jgi:hypothetical protein